LTREAPQEGVAMQRSLAGATAPRSRLPQVTFVADLVCPWCYLGFERLQAVAAREPFRLVWHPFLLNPHLPPDGIPRSVYLERKFGAGYAEEAQRRAVRAAAAEGLELKLDRIRRQPSTVLAHALLLRSGEHLAAAARALYEAFFRDGRDLGSVTVLADIGARFGIGIDEVRSASARVGASHDAACRSGIDGVPLFLFGEDHAIAGAQPPACLEALLQLERYRLSLAEPG
jgi:predicted DsbA family dithiol-disulfide isomerase